MEARMQSTGDLKLLARKTCWDPNSTTVQANKDDDDRLMLFILLR